MRAWRTEPELRGVDSPLLYAQEEVEKEMVSARQTTSAAVRAHAHDHALRISMEMKQ